MKTSHYHTRRATSRPEELWIDFPNYKIRSNSDLMPLFVDKPKELLIVFVSNYGGNVWKLLTDKIDNFTK